MTQASSLPLSPQLKLRVKVDVLLLSVLPLEHEAALEAAHASPIKVFPPGLEGGLVMANVGPRSLQFGIGRLSERMGYVGDGGLLSFVDELKPRVVAMCGICSGIRGEVDIGDVIVADAVLRYEATTRDPAAGVLVYRLSPRYRALALDMPEIPGLPGRARVGTLATGRRVLESAVARTHLRQTTRKVLGFELETEAAHVMASANWIVAKGVADLDGLPKDDSARRAAAVASARWLISFVSERVLQ